MFELLYAFFTIILGFASLLMGVHYLRKTRKTPKGKLVPLMGGVYVSRGVAYTLVFYLWCLGVLFIVAPIVIILHQAQAG